MADTRPAAPPRRGGRSWAPSQGFLAKAALITAVLTAVGSLLGLVRDQILAHLFGAGPDTDAFLVAWTVPEFASTLLIEDAMALILVPAFSRALAQRHAGGAVDPVRTLVRSTLPRLALVTGAVAALFAAGAPWVVRALAPGLAEPGLAVDCTRLTATCVFTFALAGYCSAALRAHGRFLEPAAIYTAYNTGIIATVVLLFRAWGVRAAAAGVAVGGALMVVIQAPSLVRKLTRRHAGDPGTGGDGHRVVLALVAPVIAFAAGRQSQVLVERFLAAPLPSGAISHLNYAQKVAQMPMILSLILCTVSFPVVARALAAGDTALARRRVERDLLLAAVVVLAGAAAVIAGAPAIVDVLFQRGAFDRSDTAATAAVMRVYALGLLGQTLVGALVRCYFSAARPLWYPAAVMLTGLAATALTGALWVGPWGVRGIAAANALGITLTAALLLAGIRGQSIPLRTGVVCAGLARLGLAAAGACLVAHRCSAAVGRPLLAAVTACAVVAVVFPLLAWAVRAPEVPSLIRSAARRLAHVRCHGSRPLPDRDATDPSSAAETTPVGGHVPRRRRPHG
ncbi:lipid II flippase MurJ [Streptomyces purpureus]|uniref:Membrane protein n=1 Tax=Streptomyces purpureus TaxID=1951 RepID=A0A918HD27_9ACTN|nr:lipid II flippase MurJ [Streptomyces purpureus]GGT52867.1 membrane protein [Streptomyces purpureus]